MYQPVLMTAIFVLCMVDYTVCPEKSGTEFIFIILDNRFEKSTLYIPYRRKKSRGKVTKMEGVTKIFPGQFERGGDTIFGKVKKLFPIRYSLQFLNFYDITIFLYLILFHFFPDTLYV